MCQPSDPWKVLPHGRLAVVDDNVLTAVGRGRPPLGALPRRMAVVRLRDGRLVIFGAVALPDGELRALEGYGHPSFLVVPGDRHRVDALAWKRRYPAMQVVAPAGAFETVHAVVPVDTVAPRFDDAGVQWITVPGTRGHEAALLVRGRRGKTLVLNDIVANMRRPPGLGGWMLRLAGRAGDAPRIPGRRPFGVVKDAWALREQLLDWSEIADLRRILVSRGEPIVDDPRGVLRGLAGALQ